MDTFSNREIALAFWLVALAVLALSYRISRELFFEFCKHLLKRQITSLLLCYSLYVVIAAICLEAWGLWDTNQVKNTLIWFVFVGISAIVSAVKNANGQAHFGDWIYDQIKIIVIIEYLISVDSLPLIAEIILIPIVFLIGLTSTYSKRDEKNKIVGKICDNLILIFGLFLLSHAFISAWSNHESLLTKETLQDFYTPIALSISLLPFLYGVYIYSSYERVIISIKFTIKDKSVRKYAFLLAIINFRSNVDLLDRWKRRVFLEPPTSKQEVVESIKKIIKVKRMEKNPISVSPENGWSPYAAQKFLEDHKIICRDYHEQYGEWFCGSNMLRIEDGHNLSNTIAYYIRGTEISAKELSLTLDVNNLSIANQSEELFRHLAAKILRKAVTDYPEPEMTHLLDNENSQDNPKAFLTAQHNRIETACGYTRTIKIALNYTPQCAHAIVRE